MRQRSSLQQIRINLGIRPLLTVHSTMILCVVLPGKHLRRRHSRAELISSSVFDIFYMLLSSLNIPVNFILVFYLFVF
ncbi:hypothetical protein POJ06DRAFT_246308 [Lipomyces tetrasporus]|uniref:Uncharacterized protein n=1 Tax=Lipomyces tetrasporus TaxID=54092 RepID=A0AAD7QWX5_9ASCO|nr:uncharacterized protein POJ06DRAFT_246308 [Lipomyces tetrasporus]KAJ8103009.1 hypothetical protein POJ06DRAFT_246308 [Lipomyces tetrasporus]